MDPFKVICVTCHAKLSVRNEALIGQIVACPRCESMVEVARPASPATAAAVIASTESTINLSARQIEEVNQAVEEASRAASADEPALETPPAPSEAAETVPVEVLQASAEVAKYKVITWSVASFVIGATLVGAIVYRSGNSPDQTPSTPIVDSDSVSIEPQAESTPRVEQLLTTSEAEVPPPGASFDAASDETQVEAELSPAIDAETVAAEPLPTATEQPEPLDPITPETPSDDSPKLTIEPAPRVAKRFDPLAFDLESLSLAKLEQEQAPKTQAVDDLEAETTEEATEAEPPPAAEPMAPKIVRLGENEDQPNNRDAAEQLKLTVPSLQLADMSLLDSLQLISELSGQPISVAPEQLLMAGINSHKKVSLQAKDTSLGQILEQILSPLQLNYETPGPHVVVRRREATKLREISYPIDDLIVDELTAEQLAGWIERLVAPESWQSAGGNGLIETKADTILITQPQYVQYQVLILLERLRLAKDLAPKSRFPVERLVGSPALMEIEDNLAASTTFTFTRLTPLAEIFAHWRVEFNAPLLIDWPSLADVQRYPSTPVACAIVDEPWDVALDNILKPLGLGWRAVTGGAIEITSADKARHALQVELYQVNPIGKQLLDELESLAEQHGHNDGASLLYDPASKVLLASQPGEAMRAIYRKLKHENLLDVR